MPICNQIINRVFMIKFRLYQTVSLKLFVVPSLYVSVNMANFENEPSTSYAGLNDSIVSIGGENSHDSQEEAENSAQGDEEQKEKLVKLPIGRIKTIIKMDPEVHMINQEAVFLITKSAELFISNLAREAYKYTALLKKKSVQKRDVEHVIHNVDSLVFLEGMLD